MQVYNLARHCGLSEKRVHEYRSKYKITMVELMEMLLSDKLTTREKKIRLYTYPNVTEQVADTIWSRYIQKQGLRHKATMNLAVSYAVQYKVGGY